MAAKLCDDIDFINNLGKCKVPAVYDSKHTTAFGEKMDTSFCEKHLVPMIELFMKYQVKEFTITRR